MRVPKVQIVILLVYVLLAGVMILGGRQVLTIATWGCPRYLMFRMLGRLVGIHAPGIAVLLLIVH
jgi:hypothetical protein